MDELRTRLRLSEIVGKRVRLTRAGHEYKGCCPFHRENTPSFYVNDDKQFFHCFGCGAHGDHIGFVMRHDNIEFMDAIEMLASEAGLQIPKPSPKDVENARKQKQLKTIMEDACRFFEDQLYLPENAAILDYVTKRRGLTPETVAAFRLGYAPDHGQALRLHLKRKGWSDQDMIDTALARPAKSTGQGGIREGGKGGGKQSREPYAFFRDRVMFPVLDRQGQVVAFGGRILPEDIRPIDPSSDFKPPKYMNSTDTPLFHKGAMLYNESHARQNCAAGHDLIVVEGYADVIALAQAGFKAAVAPLGTALTERQIEILWNLLPHDGVDVERIGPFAQDDHALQQGIKAEPVPYLCFDGDMAGNRAATRAVDRLLPLLKPGKTARFVFLPEGQDPDDLIRAHGPEAMRELLAKSVSLLEMLWIMHTRGRQLDTPESRAAVEQRLEQAVAAIADRTVQGYYKSLLKDRIWRELKGGGRVGGQGRGAGDAQGRGAGGYGSGSYGAGSYGFGGSGGYGRGGKNDPRAAALARMTLPSPKQSSGVLREKILLAALLNHPHVFEDIAEQIGMAVFRHPAYDALKQSVFHILGREADMNAADLLARLQEMNKHDILAEIMNESVYIHAGFARPDSDASLVREGVLDILQRERRPVSGVS